MRTAYLGGFPFLALALALSPLACETKSSEPAPQAEPAVEAKAAAPSSLAPKLTTPPAAAQHPPHEPPQPNNIPAPADVAAAPSDAKKTASGLASKVLTAGKGKEHPTDQDQVKVHYTGWTSDGKMFDSSVARGEPTSFGVTQVIAGWTEALKLMVTGEKRRLWIPAKLAYGETPRPGAPAGKPMA